MIVSWLLLLCLAAGAFAQLVPAGVRTEDIRALREPQERPRMRPLTSEEANTFIFVHFGPKNSTQLKSPYFICAMEAVHRLNPQARLIVIGPNSNLTESNLPPTVDRSRVWYLPYSHLKAEAKNTPLEGIWETETESFKGFKDWSYKVSDAARILALHNYGGMYVDADVMMQSSPAQPRTAMVVPEGSRLTNAVMSFPAGSDLTWIMMEKIRDEFQAMGQRWGGMGPDLITSVVTQECGVRYNKTSKEWSQPTRNTDRHCANLRVADAAEYFPVPGKQSKLYWKTLADVPDEIRGKMGQASGFHWWSSNLSPVAARNLVALDTNLGQLALRLCPDTSAMHAKAMFLPASVTASTASNYTNLVAPRRPRRTG